MNRPMTAFGTSRASGDVRRESAKWAKADIDAPQAAGPPSASIGQSTTLNLAPARSTIVALGVFCGRCTLTPSTARSCMMIGVPSVSC
jgi:hypothetical protein